MTWVHGVDVSHWQAPGLALPAGIQFAWIKASQGGGRDRNLRAHHADLTRRGLKVGAYCYYEFGTTPERNAETFIQATADLHWDLPHALDAEDDTGAGKAANAAALLRFLDLVERATGRVPVVYTGRFWWQDKVGGDQRFARYPLWLAGYPGPNDGTPPRDGRTYPVPAPWTGHAVWQYSSTSGRLDRNVATPAAYAALLGDTRPTPLATPTEPQELTVSQIDDIMEELAASKARDGRLGAGIIAVAAGQEQTRQALAGIARGVVIVAGQNVDIAADAKAALAELEQIADSLDAPAQMPDLNPGA